MFKNLENYINLKHNFKRVETFRNILKIMNISYISEKSKNIYYILHHIYTLLYILIYLILFCLVLSYPVASHPVLSYGYRKG